MLLAAEKVPWGIAQESILWGSNAVWPHFGRTTGISSGHSPAGRATFGRSSVILRVHSAHCARNSLQHPKNDRVAMLGFYVNRPW